MEKLDVVNSVLTALHTGRPCELVVVAGTAGSSPRGVGAWMALFDDGHQAGTVGGGKVELHACEEALELLSQGSSRVVRYTMGGESSDTGMICGGAICLVYLYLEPLRAQLFEDVARILEKRRIGDFRIDLTPFADHALEGDPAERHGEGSRRTVPGCPDLAIDFDATATTYTNAATGLPQAHIETLCPEGFTYVFGAGHVGAATVRALAAADFAVVACDDRPALVAPGMLPQACDRRVVDYENLAATCAIGPRDLVVIATAGHVSDITCTVQAMRAKPAYVGCLGSRRKTKKVHQALADEGFTDEQIEALHLPIGVSIEAETPAEIAVSIAAELVHTRRTKLVPRVRIGKS